MRFDFRRLFEEHGTWLIELAGSILGARSDAEDVVQEAFIKAYRSQDGFRGEANVGTWLRRIVMNEALDFRRRARGRGKERRLVVSSEASGDEQPSRAAGPDATAIDRERAEAVRRAIEALPEDQRVVILLREIEELGYREIADLLELPLGTVESRVIRGRERLRLALRRRLGHDGDEERDESEHREKEAPRA